MCILPNIIPPKPIQYVKAKFIFFLFSCVLFLFWYFVGLGLDWCGGGVGVARGETACYNVRRIA